mmetsp:Transcript_31468/g.55622  ORF Transcript_31468/g.55622 Transcript_31468/m.55622 type:complete len:205 (-) Transcript_31468:634-1248(-)
MNGSAQSPTHWHSKPSLQFPQCPVGEKQGPHDSPKDLFDMGGHAQQLSPIWRRPLPSWQMSFGHAANAQVSPGQAQQFSPIWRRLLPSWQRSAGHTADAHFPSGQAQQFSPIWRRLLPSLQMSAGHIADAHFSSGQAQHFSPIWRRPLPSWQMSAGHTADAQFLAPSSEAPGAGGTYSPRVSPPSTTLTTFVAVSPAWTLTAVG